MPRLLGLHNLFGVLAAVLAGAVLGLLQVNGLIQVLVVVITYVVGSVVAHNVLRKRRASLAGAEEPDADGPRFHHFDSRAMEHIDRERRSSGRRENTSGEDDPAG